MSSGVGDGVGVGSMAVVGDGARSDDDDDVVAFIWEAAPTEATAVAVSDTALIRNCR